MFLFSSRSLCRAVTCGLSAWSSTWCCAATLRSTPSTTVAPSPRTWGRRLWRAASTSPKMSGARSLRWPRTSYASESFSFVSRYLVWPASRNKPFPYCVRLLRLFLPDAGLCLPSSGAPCRLLKVKPEERLTIEGVLAHPWLNCTEALDNVLPSAQMMMDKVRGKLKGQWMIWPAEATVER